MSARRSLTVTGSVELQLDTFAERVAVRVVELLTTAGSHSYDRDVPSDSDPASGPRHGARFGAVDEAGLTYDPTTPDPTTPEETLS